MTAKQSKEVFTELLSREPQIRMMKIMFKHIENEVRKGNDKNAYELAQNLAYALKPGCKYLNFMLEQIRQKLVKQ
jgi:hypothetical protein